MTSFRLKPVKITGRETVIVLQNENGPCPLLAIVHPDYSMVTHDQIVSYSQISMLGDVLISTKPQFTSEDQRLNYDRNVADAIPILPTLQHGLDVNVRFTGIHDFEFTTQCLVFDLLSIIPAYPQDKVTAEVVSKYSYNQLMEKLVLYSTIQALPAQVKSFHSRCPAARPTHLHREMDCHRCACAHRDREEKNEESSAATPPTLERRDSRAKMHLRVSRAPAAPKDSGSSLKLDPAVLVRSMSQEEKDRVCREATIIERFLEQTASQLTYYGLSELHQKLKEGELVVFFRNNHFSTMVKFQNELFLLVTDLGYLSERDIVWEKLSEVEGDTTFYDGNFRRYVKREGQHTPTLSPGPAGTYAQIPQDTSSDLLLAQRLQEEEMRKAQGRRELTKSQKKELKKAQLRKALDDEDDCSIL